MGAGEAEAEARRAQATVDAGRKPVRVVGADSPGPFAHAHNRRFHRWNADVVRSPAHHPFRRLVAPRGRLLRRRMRRLGAGADRLRAGHGDSAHGRGLADRRLRRLAKAGGRGVAAVRRQRGMVARLRLFRRGPMVARRGRARGGGPIRLGAAARRVRNSGRPRAVHGPWFRVGAAAMVAGLRPRLRSGRWPRRRRMAARSCSDGLPLERFRHGARERAYSRASGLADWASRTRPRGDFDIRGAGDADRRAPRPLRLAGDHIRRRRCSWRSPPMARSGFRKARPASSRARNCG